MLSNAENTRRRNGVCIECGEAPVVQTLRCEPCKARDRVLRAVRLRARMDAARQQERERDEAEKNRPARRVVTIGRQQFEIMND